MTMWFCKIFPTFLRLQPRPGLRPQCELCMLRIKIDKIYVSEVRFGAALGLFTKVCAILHRVVSEDTWDSSLCDFCCFFGWEFSHSCDSCILWRSSLSQSHCMLDVAILRRRHLSWQRALSMRFRGGWAGRVAIERFEPLFFSALHFFPDV